ncbi:hypothetical protein U9M48_008250 [Paspalum notatum var. saurae]|uniref:Uncharacterized protein n=1 Tax=Paspalum notatum var. saurae TaxID=547442 RepID=A0AAQ3SP65_PASNO
MRWRLAGRNLQWAGWAAAVEKVEKAKEKKRKGPKGQPEMQSTLWNFNRGVTELHESNVDAARNVSNWVGTCFFTPLIGAFLADTYWGRYWTLVIFLSVFAVGVLIIDGRSPRPRLPLLMMGSPHRSGTGSAVVYLGLYLVALGEGGIKPCTSTLGAEQFDAADSVERLFFNLYYSINVGSLLPGTVLVWAQDNVGWGVGFVVPTVSMAAIVATPTGDGDKGEAVVTPTDPWRLCTVSQVEELKQLLQMFPVWASMVLFFVATAQMSSTLIGQGAAMDNRLGSLVLPPASLATFDDVSVMVCIPLYDAVLVPVARRITGKHRGLS